jgi:hypothetical protein
MIKALSLELGSEYWLNHSLQYRAVVVGGVATRSTNTIPLA